jgi:isoprenylcysteine carboxyl methyltransferase (ICMT) family protein YpbQ
MPLVKLRSQVLRKHQKESKDSGAMEIALQSTSLFSLLAFFLFQVSTIKAGIMDTNLSIQIFNLACLCWLFASCIKNIGKEIREKIR